jgi:HK97 family phage major capsid protein
MKYQIRDFASFSPIASRIVDDANYDLVQYFEKVHAEKAVKTENKIVFNTIRTSKVAKALADIPALKTSLNKDLNPSLENEIVVVTNQDGYELFNNLDSNVNPVKTVGDNSQKRYLDVYRFEVYSNEELPSQNGKAPFIYGSLERSVKLFDLEMIDILLIHYPFGNRSMVHVLRGIEHFDVELVPETPHLIYGEIPLPVV